jgi:hypothetical protein
MSTIGDLCRIMDNLLIPRVAAADLVFGDVVPAILDAGLDTSHGEVGVTDIDVIEMDLDARLLGLA